LFLFILCFIQFIVVVLILENVIADDSIRFSTEKATFSVKFKDEVSPYRVLGVFVLPDETLKIMAVDRDKSIVFDLTASDGTVIEESAQSWKWRAPQKAGLYPIKISKPIINDSIILNVFVMVPYRKINGEYLGNYRIGTYPTIPLKKLPIYKPPVGFIEVTEENENTLLSPHFSLKQFLCKQDSGYPKYLVLRERLLLKLEPILEKVNQNGYPSHTFHIMSGYRTPYYNKAIGNVRYSRHVYGGAADIFIDEHPKDDIMDDLNGDGKINYEDAGILYNIIDGMYGKPWYDVFIGGLGRYKKTAHHGPYVHIDARGFRARWGD